MSKNEIEQVKEKEQKNEKVSDRPFLRYVYEKNSETAKNKVSAIELSDGTKEGTPEYYRKVLQALKSSTGCENPVIAERILSRIGWGMSSNNPEQRMEVVNILLHTLEPQGELEAMLLGQFLALQDSGLTCLRDANYNDGFYHKKELFLLSTKLFRCANDTMQTLLKYRSGGKQQIQVIHVSGEAKAVIANEMKSGGSSEKNCV